MAVFISTSVDSFTEVRAAQAKNREVHSGVRRPIRGIEIKGERFAYLRVVKSDGTVIDMVNGGARAQNVHSGTGWSKGTTNFLLQSVSEQRVEKSQVVETFGEDFIFLFGERPRMISFNALLMNTEDFDWKNEFLYNYDNYFRGTKTLELDARVYITYDDVMVEGYVLSTNLDLQVDAPSTASLAFQLFVTNSTFLRSPGSAIIPGYGTDLPPESAGVSGVDREVVLDRPPVYGDRDEYVFPDHLDWIHGDPPETSSAWGEAADSVMFGIQSGVGIALRNLSDLTAMGVDAAAPLYQALLTGPNAFGGIPSPDATGISQVKGDINNIAAGWQATPAPSIELLPPPPPPPVF